LIRSLLCMSRWWWVGHCLFSPYDSAISWLCSSTYSVTIHPWSLVRANFSLAWHCDLAELAFTSGAGLPCGVHHVDGR
jgi:hypothetical protein